MEASTVLSSPTSNVTSPILSTASLVPNMLSSSSSSSSPLPVTILSGFLGSGKTTLLQRILMNRQGLRIGVIVNDMSEVNIDAALIAEGQTVIHRLVDTPSTSSSSSSSDEVSSEMVALSNGCICCTLREDLLTVMIKLANEKKFDYLVIESSGISEPLPVAETFTFVDETTGNRLSDIARLDTMVTVVDAFHWLKDYDSNATLADRQLAVNTTDTRGVVDLLIDQIEFSNIILINKIDLVKERTEIDRLKAIIRTLNPDARILESIRADIPLTDVLNTHLFSFEKASSAPGWLKEIRGQHIPETLEYGISSFVFRASRPFHPQRLYDALAHSGEATSPLRCIIRSKGFVWLAIDGGMDEVALWAQAGRIWQLSAGRPWWITLPKEEWPVSMLTVIQDALNKYPENNNTTDGTYLYGDRATELVIIGMNMDKTIVQSTLQNCILTDDEWALGRDAWDLYDDPFDFYAYEDEDEEGDDEEDGNDEENDDNDDDKEEETHSHEHGPHCSHGHHHHNPSQPTTMVGTDVRDIEGEGPKIFRLIASE